MRNDKPMKTTIEPIEVNKPTPKTYTRDQAIASVEFKARVLECVNQRQEICQEVDGFRYYWPHNHPHGCLSAAALRIIADELDRLNEPIEKIIEEQLNEHTRPT